MVLESVLLLFLFCILLEISSTTALLNNGFQKAFLSIGVTIQLIAVRSATEPASSACRHICLKKLVQSVTPWEWWWYFKHFWKCLLNSWKLQIYTRHLWSWLELSTSLKSVWNYLTRETIQFNKHTIYLQITIRKNVIWNAGSRSWGRQRQVKKTESKLLSKIRQPNTGRMSRGWYVSSREKLSNLSHQPGNGQIMQESYIGPGQPQKKILIMVEHKMLHIGEAENKGLMRSLITGVLVIQGGGL